MKALVLFPIRFYRLFISPLLGANCRYEPGCSAYAEEAVRRHGAWAGGWMMTARLCRCHPLAGWGVDPVPETLAPKAHWYAPWRYGVWSWRKPDLGPPGP